MGMVSMYRGKVFIGMEVGRLTVSKIGERINNRQYWICQCKCGKTKSVRGDHLLSGRISSCTCYMRESISNRVTTHNMSFSPEFGIWADMIQRCTNPKRKCYERYGGRGISVCSRWRNSFEDFYKDMGDRPSPLHSIDRINCNGDYEPGNCKWSTIIEQQRNKRSTKWITLDGKTKSLSEWAEISGNKQATIGRRLKNGWSPKSAVFDPPIYNPRWA